ncbi:RHOMBOID-like protein 1, partial [Ananas comosus]
MGKETNQRGRGDSNSIYPLEMNPTANRARPPSAPSKGDYKPFRQWFPWLVPTFIVANVALFIITMFVNDCPGNVGADSCVLRRLLGRFAFQPLRENPLLGPSST